MKALRSWASQKERLKAEDLAHSTASEKAVWSWAVVMAHSLVPWKDEEWANAWGKRKGSVKGKEWGPWKVQAKAWHLVQHIPWAWGNALAKVVAHEWARAKAYLWADELDRWRALQLKGKARALGLAVAKESLRAHVWEWASG